MKKIIFIFLLLIPIRITLAKAIYTDYSLAEDYIDINLLESDLYKKEIETYYNTYTLEKKSVGYKKISECTMPDKFDYNDDYEVSNSVINDDVLYQSMYSTYTGVLTNFYVKFYEDTVLDDIVILNNGKNIDYNVLDEFKNKINKEIFHELSSETKIYIELHEPQETSKLEIIFKSFKTINAYSNLFIKASSSLNAGATRLNANHINFVSSTKFNEIVSKVGIMSKASFSSSNPYYRGELSYNCYDYEKVPTGIYLKEGDNLLLDDYYEKELLYIRSKSVIDDIEPTNDTVILSENIIPVAKLVQEEKMLSEKSIAKDGNPKRTNNVLKNYNPIKEMEINNKKEMFASNEINEESINKKIIYLIIILTLLLIFILHRYLK